MRKFLMITNRLSEWSGKIVSLLVYFGILMLVFEVIARYFFDSPTVWAHGYCQRIFGSYFVLIGAYTLLQNGHVRVDVFYRRFSVRKRAFLDVINYGMLLLWSCVLVKEGITFFANSWALRETDEMVLAHPIYPVKFLLVVGVVLITLQGLNQLFLSVHVLVKGVKFKL
jgi:TRAP-type mannitol/chloroaromatic compound transport system permease small subunit